VKFCNVVEPVARRVLCECRKCSKSEKKLVLVADVVVARRAV